jgi:hypothetical protein
MRLSTFVTPTAETPERFRPFNNYSSVGAGERGLTRNAHCFALIFATRKQSTGTSSRRSTRNSSTHVRSLERPRTQRWPRVVGMSVRVGNPRWPTPMVHPALASCCCISA